MYGLVALRVLAASGAHQEKKKRVTEKGLSSLEHLWGEERVEVVEGVLQEGHLGEVSLFEVGMGHQLQLGLDQPKQGQPAQHAHTLLHRATGHFRAPTQQLLQSRSSSVYSLDITLAH